MAVVVAVRARTREGQGEDEGSRLVLKNFEWWASGFAGFGDGDASLGTRAGNRVLEIQ